MCWSGEASGVLAIVGLSTAAYLAIKKGESKELWISLNYFALMELLQAVTYIYIDLCDNPSNQILTVLLFTCRVPAIFVNMVAMYFIPVSVKLKIRTTVYTICAIGSLAMLVKMYPFGWAGTCHIGVEGFCGPSVCSTSGSWHIAWQMPLNGIMSDPVKVAFGFDWGIHAFTYIAVAFYMPFIYGSWRFVSFHYLIGPFISDITTTDPNEYAAVWCLFSIALCLSVIKTPIRKYLHVKKWAFL